MKRMIPILAVTLLLPLVVTACSVPDNSGASREAEATKTLFDQAAVAIGLPAVQNWTEKRQLKMLYELRDKAKLTTYSYYVDLNGKLHQVCPTTSVGFGMPFSAQYTSPRVLSSNRPVNRVFDAGTRQTWEAPQPEPNGLYMPDSTSATWVICLGEDGKKLNPVYVEPQIIVSLTPMKTQ